MSDEQVAAEAPLAARMRPRTLGEFVGQEHMLGPGQGAARARSRATSCSSMIFWGPPGWARRRSAGSSPHDDRRATSSSSRAVSSGTADIRAAISARARRARRAARARSSSSTRSTASTRPSRTRCSRTSRTVSLTLIGATTENPYFEVNSALLSRCQLYRFEPLRPAGRAGRERRAERCGAGPGGKAVELARRSRSSRRSRAATRAWRSTRSRPRSAAAPRRAPLQSRRGPPPGRGADADRRRPARRRPESAGQLRPRGLHYDTISAFIKSMRGSDPDAAIYYMASRCWRRRGPAFIARRMIVFASEDVGNADPQASQVAIAASPRWSSSACPSAASTEPGGGVPGTRAQVQRRAQGRRCGAWTTCAARATSLLLRISATRTIAARRN